MVLIIKLIVIAALSIFLIARWIVRHRPKITIISGKGEGQTRIITGYDADTKTMKLNYGFDPLPDRTSKYRTWR